MLINKITTGFVIQTFNTDTQKFEKQEFVAGEVEYEDVEGNSVDSNVMLAEETEPYLPFDMVQPSERKDGEHLFADCGGVPRCVTCGEEETDFFVIGDGECSYKNK